MFHLLNGTKKLIRALEGLLPAFGPSTDNGGWDVLKQVEKNAFRRLALSISLLALTPLWNRVGIEQGDLLSFFTVFQKLF